MARIATWGQLEKETTPAWEAFRLYRDLGPRRSLRIASSEVGKSLGLLSRWSSRHKWVERCAAWDLEQEELRRGARVKAIDDANERHGKLARALLGKAAAELGAHVKNRCGHCGMSPTKFTAAQLSTALKAGVEVERLSLGLATAGAPVVTQTNSVTMNNSATTALVILRDGESQRLASELLGRMKTLDPATSLRRLAGRAAERAAKEAELEEQEAAEPARGQMAVIAAKRKAAAERAERDERATDPGPKSAAEELGLEETAEDLEQERADLEQLEERDEERAHAAKAPERTQAQYDRRARRARRKRAAGVPLLDHERRALAMEERAAGVDQGDGDELAEDGDLF